MATDATDNQESIRNRILEQINRSERGKWPIKIKTLMAEFGYVAVQRLRQSSLDEVLHKLKEWDIEYRFPGGNTINDYITLSQGHVEPVAQPTNFQPSTPIVEAHCEDFSPLAFLFRINDALDDARSQALALDIQNAVWSFRPVCLLVDAEDEFFSFACGFLSAIMRRRALMVHFGVSAESVPLAPEVITIDLLKRLIGQIAEPGFNDVSQVRRRLHPSRQTW